MEEGGHRYRIRQPAENPYGARGFAQQDLVAEADFLRNPEDPREERVFQPKIPVDEFVLKYRKPE